MALEPRGRSGRGSRGTCECEERGLAGVACGRGRGRGRPAAPAVARGWSCPWRRHRPWALRPAAPYRALAEWPRGAGALPPAGGGRTGRRDRPGLGERCFSFTFLPCEAGAPAGEERRRPPRGRYPASLRVAEGPGPRSPPSSLPKFAPGAGATPPGTCRVGNRGSPRGVGGVVGWGLGESVARLRRGGEGGGLRARREAVRPPQCRPRPT